MKAHRALASEAMDFSTRGPSKQAEIVEKPLRMFPAQTDLNQEAGRAAQRYANVDREEFESHMSLSSCTSDARQFTN